MVLSSVRLPPTKGTARVNNVFDAQLMSHQKEPNISYLILLTALSSAQALHSTGQHYSGCSLTSLYKFQVTKYKAY